LLADTNVLVYAYDPVDAAKQARAISILSTLQSNRRGTISAQILGEFFNSVTRRIRTPLSLADAEREVAHFALGWAVLDITPSVVLEAVQFVQRHPMAYWDGLIWATARLNGIATVLSEDFNDGATLEGVRFLNPFASHFDMRMLTDR